MSPQQARFDRAEMPSCPGPTAKPDPQTKKDQLSLAQYRE